MYFQKLIEDFKKIEEVEALALGGSRASSNYDEKSDYDLYVYVKKIPPLEIRKAILEKYCKYIELSNSYWGLEDDCTFKDDIDIDILYRKLDDFSKSISMVVDDCVAFNAYTTCLWHNLKTSKILFDRNGRLKALKDKYNVDYPEVLKKNIIKRNINLITGKLPSYDKQIKKAVARHDLISVNHRLAAFLETYFDVIFALNGHTHPGEKRMLSYVLKECKILPNNFESNINKLFISIFKDDKAFLDTLDNMIVELKKVIELSI